MTTRNSVKGRQTTASLTSASGLDFDHRPTLDEKKEKKKKVFVDAEEMKAKIREQTLKPIYNVAIYYYTRGIWQKIAKHSLFEQITLSVIALNALWISIDTDLNTADVITQADPVFQVAEHFFCFYFSFEWTVRFMAFKRKRDGFRDTWFVFDSILVLMMVLETWVMAVLMVMAGPSGASSIMGNASMLRMARLMRLSRMARMARLFRAMPQLLIVVKALLASLSSCGFVFVLLIVITYVFGIALRQLTAGYHVGEQFFQSVPQSMYTLWVDGTILDNPHILSKELWIANPVFPFVFWAFTGLSALLIMNMLIGVLCEVVTAVSGAEKERYNAEYVKGRLQEIITNSGLDKNGDGQISKAELSRLLEIPKAHEALADVGVDVFMLVDNIDFIFSKGPEDDEDDEAELTFEEFMSLVLELRGTNTATVNDVVDLKKYIKRANANLRDEVRKAFGSVGLERVPTAARIADGAESLPVSHSQQVLEVGRTRSQPQISNGTSAHLQHEAIYQRGSNDAAPAVAVVAVETLRQEFDTLLQRSLIPELSKVCNARQQEMQEELSDLITQLRREFTTQVFPQETRTEIVFTESVSPSMRPPYSEVPLASGGGILNKAKKGLAMDAQPTGTTSPRQAGHVKAKDKHGQGSCPHAPRGC